MPDNLRYFMQMRYQLSDSAIGLNDSQLASDDHFVSEGIKKTIQAFSKMIEFSEKFAQLNGLAVRIAEVLEVFEELADSTQSFGTTSDGTIDVDRTPSDTIRLADADLVTPVGLCLASGVNLEITPKTPLMVTGANATGKSSVARVLGGLWPVQNGSLSVPTRDANDNAVAPIFLVPQRVYSVVGSLADQVTYPTIVKKEARTAEIEQRLQEVLDVVSDANP